MQRNRLDLGVLEWHDMFLIPKQASQAYHPPTSLLGESKKSKTTKRLRVITQAWFSWVYIPQKWGFWESSPTDNQKASRHHFFSKSSIFVEDGRGAHTKDLHVPFIHTKMCMIFPCICRILYPGDWYYQGRLVRRLNNRAKAGMRALVCS